MGGVRKYKIPIKLTVPFKISPQDIMYPKRNYDIEYGRAVDSGRICDYDSFIIDIAEKGVLADFMWLAMHGYNFHMGEKELYVFMRRWGLIGDKGDRRFKTIAHELGLVQCNECEDDAKALILRAYRNFNKPCPRVKDVWQYYYDQARGLK